MLHEGAGPRCAICGLGSARLTQHPDEHGPERPVLLAVDQQLGEGATLRVAPELSDPVGSLEVRESQDVEEFSAGSWPKGVQELRRRRSSSSVSLDESLRCYGAAACTVE
jgi:hypothetical protein